MPLRSSCSRTTCSWRDRVQIAYHSTAGVVSVSTVESGVARLLSGAKVGYFALACVLLATGVVINALRWRYVMSALDDPIDLITAMVGSFEAMFFNQLYEQLWPGQGSRLL